MSYIERRPDDLLGPLNEIERKNAPALLYLAGVEAIFNAGPRVAVVGSRRMSAEGADRTRALVRALEERGMVVVSGLAEGIDTVAHKTTIGLGGRTIAVLGTPLDRCFPAKNHRLQERIAHEHLAISQFSPGSAVHRSNFPVRNRTIALLSDAMVIVEAHEASGTMHASWEALRLGRLLFLDESVAKDAGVPWAKELLRYGAQVLTRENVRLVVENIPQRRWQDAIPF